jgi:hypothetical protein
MPHCRCRKFIRSLLLLNFKHAHGSMQRTGNAHQHGQIGGFSIIWSQKVWGGGRKFDLVLLAIAVEVTADMSMNIKPKEGFQSCVCVCACVCVCVCVCVWGGGCRSRRGTCSSAHCPCRRCLWLRSLCLPHQRSTWEQSRGAQLAARPGLEITLQPHRTCQQLREVQSRLPST